MPFYLYLPANIALSLNESEQRLPPMMKFLIVGLGNPGTEYQGSRHNLGFDLASAFADKLQAPFRSDRLGWVAEGRIKNRSFVILQPSTYMNLSGKAVKYWMDQTRIPLENILILVDDLALDLGKFRLRAGGSSAGHNGLKNIEEVLGTDRYPRLRLGIGRDFPRGRQVEFVLGKWTPEEAKQLASRMDRGVEIIQSFAFAGLTKTMSLFND